MHDFSPVAWAGARGMTGSYDDCRGGAVCQSSPPQQYYTNTALTTITSSHNTSETITSLTRPFLPPHPSPLQTPSPGGCLAPPP